MTSCFQVRVFLLLLISYIPLCGKSITINNQTKFMDVLANSSVFINNNKELKDNYIIEGNFGFLDNNKSNLKYGYDPEFDVWVKVKIYNTSKNKLKRILEYDNSLTTSVVFFSPDNDYEGEHDGLFNIKQNRKTINPVFEINLNPLEEKTYYIKASSKITTLIVKLNLWEEKEFYFKESQHKMYLGIFFGAMFILAIYNLFVYFFTRDKSYIYYVCYIAGLSLHHFIYIGFANIYFSQELLITSIEYAPLIIAFPVIALGLFTSTFLKVKQYRRLSFILNLSLVVVPIAAFLIINTEGYEEYRNMLTMLLLFYLVLITVYSSLKKNRQAYFILFGWFVIFVAVLLMVLSSSGIFSIFEYFSYPIEIAFLLEVTTFSIALADRINKLRNEKANLTQQIIEQKTTETKRLEKVVMKKTENLNHTLIEKDLLLKELNHRVKNNMQMIISLIRLQSEEVNNEEFKKILIVIQSRINAMSQLHDLLYRQDNIVSLKTDEYFTSIVNELHYNYNEDEDIEIILNVNCNLNIEDLLYCGLILNELITNSFKYGFVDGVGEIQIELYQEDNKYHLRTRDNGIGFEQNMSKDTLGLVLIKALVEDQLDGAIEITSTNGVDTKITWSTYE